MKSLMTLLILIFFAGCGNNGSATSKSSGGNASSEGSIKDTTGKGGSMARFVIAGNYLYTLNKREITAFDITDPDDPLPYTKDSVPWDVQTLFAYGDYLYIGAKGGVYLYNKPTPSKGMELKATYTHLKSCDPVVVENGFAYFTLNNSRTCGLKNGVNALEILDVSDPLNPKISKNSDGEENRKNMIDPKGLGVDGNILFVCDGIGGLKLFDINRSENNQSIIDLTFNRKSSISDIDCYDVIPYKHNLIVSNGKDVRQFDYSKLPMVELGRIK